MNTDKSRKDDGAELGTLFDSLVFSDKTFNQYRRFLYDNAGINLSDAKKSMVASRLRKRVVDCGFDDYQSYFDYITSEEGQVGGEFQICVDRLTTNETYFYRESQHFEYLKDTIIPAFLEKRDQPIEVWCAAASSGEEPYTIAMMLDSVKELNGRWNIWATDISTRMLKRAHKAIYPTSRTAKLPQEYRRQYLMRGVRKMKDFDCVVPEIRNRVKYDVFNLISSPLPVKKFDVIFCRNVMIYFDQPTKKEVVSRLINCLNDDGWLITGHSESMNHLCPELKTVGASVYQKNHERGRVK